jgi:hypothetical protein
MDVFNTDFDKPKFGSKNPSLKHPAAGGGVKLVFTGDE